MSDLVGIQIVGFLTHRLKFLAEAGSAEAKCHTGFPEKAIQVEQQQIQMKSK